MDVPLPLTHRKYRHVGSKIWVRSFVTMREDCWLCNPEDVLVHMWFSVFQGRGTGLAGVQWKASASKEYVLHLACCIGSRKPSRCFQSIFKHMSPDLGLLLQGWATLALLIFQLMAGCTFSCNVMPILMAAPLLRASLPSVLSQHLPALLQLRHCQHFHIICVWERVCIFKYHCGSLQPCQVVHLG